MFKYTIYRQKKLDQNDLLKRKLPLQIKFYPLRPLKTEVEFALKVFFLKYKHL